MKKLILGLLAPWLAGLGCVHLQPVGPLTKGMGSVAPVPTGKSPAVAEVAPTPVVQPAPAPPPPALFVTPAEVTSANYQQAVRRLVEEMEADRKAMEAMPLPAEVSVVKGGR